VQYEQYHKPEISMSIDFSLIVPIVALGSVVLGGGIYETLLVDRARLRNPSIEPARGRLNRRVLWTVTHPPFELALLAGLWLN
jgi:hypothetical protein